MKKSICHYSFHRRWEQEKWNLDRLAGEVKALGIEAVDFHVGFLDKPTDAVEMIKHTLSKHSLALSGLSLSNNFNQEDSGEFRAQVETTKQWIAVAAKVQAPVSRVFGGHLPQEKRNDPAFKAIVGQRVIDGLGEIVSEAEKYGVVLALENHGGLPCTGHEQVEMIEAINSPNLKATIDVGNYLEAGQEGHEGTAVAAGYAAYVHFKDFKKTPDNSAPRGWKLVPCVLGQGDVDHQACLKVLREAGYNGFVALEYEGIEGEKTGVPRSVEFMKRLI